MYCVVGVFGVWFLLVLNLCLPTVGFPFLISWMCIFGFRFVGFSGSRFLKRWKFELFVLFAYCFKPGVIQYGACFKCHKLLRRRAFVQPGGVLDGVCVSKMCFAICHQGCHTSQIAHGRSSMCRLLLQWLLNGPHAQQRCRHVDRMHCEVIGAAHRNL